MSIHILTSKATPLQVREMLEPFSEMRMIKIVVDIKREILAGGSGMHYECEQILLEDRSEQETFGERTGFLTNKVLSSKHS